MYNLRPKIQAEMPAKVHKTANSEPPISVSTLGGLGVSIINVVGRRAEKPSWFRKRTKGEQYGKIFSIDKEAGQKEHFYKTL